MIQLQLLLVMSLAFQVLNPATFGGKPDAAHNSQ